MKHQPGFVTRVVHWMLDAFCRRMARSRAGYELRLDERHGEVTYWPRTKQKRYWLHAASLGEMKLALLLQKMIYKLDAQAECLITTVTPSGSDLCLAHSKAYHSYLPYDTTWAIEQFLMQTRPDCLFIIETELWPNLLRVVKGAGISIHVVNGRLGLSSRRLQRFLNFVMPTVSKVSTVAAQSHDDAQAFLDLGAPKVSSLGNLKWCLESKAHDVMPYSLKHWCLMASSVQIGEKKALVAAWEYFKKTNQATHFIIAPRRMETLPNWQQGWGEGARVVLASLWQGEDFDVMLIDTFGQLDRFYPLADVVFVGGSWVAHGGQNVLEPAKHGKCITTGPYDFNFKQVVAMMKSSDALRQYNSVEQWIADLESYRMHPEQALAMGQRAKDFLLKMQEKTHQEYQAWLSEILVNKDS